jgi:hypothetical protein
MPPNTGAIGKPSITNRSSVHSHFFFFANLDTAAAEQKALLMQVLQLSEEQINNLQPEYREQVRQLVSDFCALCGKASSY